MFFFPLILCLEVDIRHRKQIYGTVALISSFFYEKEVVLPASHYW
jgi:hypothetical protein